MYFRLFCFVWNTTRWTGYVCKVEFDSATFMYFTFLYRKKWILQNTPVVFRASICLIQMSFHSVFPCVCLPSHKDNEIHYSLVQVGTFCFRKGFLSAKLGRNFCTLLSRKMVPSGKSYCQLLEPRGSVVSLDLMRPSFRSCSVYGKKKISFC